MEKRGRGQELKPYWIKKGQVLNPKGRRGYKDIWNWVSKIAPPEQLIEPMRKMFNIRKGKVTVETAIVLRLVLEAVRGDMKALEMWMDRKYGKVTQPMDISTENGPLVAILNAPQGDQTIRVTGSTDAQKKAIDITDQVTPTPPPTPKTQEPQDPKEVSQALEDSRG